MWGTWAGFAFLYYGTVMVITEVFAADGREYVDGDDESGYSFDYSAIFTSATAEIAGTTLILFLIDRVGRIRSQAYSYLTGGIMVCILCLLASSENSNRVLMIIIAFLARMFFMSASCATWVSTAEILTTEVRSTGHAASNAVARLGGALSPILVSGKMSYPATALVLVLVSMGTFACSWHLPETHGKALGASSPQDDKESDDHTTSTATDKLETSYEVL
jgi:MFS family permease